MMKRLNGESDGQYQIRLSIGKLIDNMDISWQEIKELLQSDKHRDTLRREAYGIVIYHLELEKEKAENNIKKFSTNDIESMKQEKKVEELEEKLLELKKERIKLREERNYVNGQIRIVSRSENFIELMKDEINRLNEEKSYSINVQELEDYASGREGVFLLSDIHYGAFTENILENYNPEICKEKMNYLVSKIIQYGKENKIEKLHVLGLGDYISGLIHNVNRFDSRTNIVEQIAGVSELLSESLFTLAEHFLIECSLIIGNHDRIVANKNDSIEEENFTVFIKEFVKYRVKDNNRITLKDTEDNGIIELKIKNSNCLAVHGNNDMDSRLSKLIEMYDYPVNYIFRGHFHSSKQFDVNRTVIVNNGAFGGESYSKNARLYNTPVQKFLVFSEDGMICSYDINLNLYNAN